MLRHFLLPSSTRILKALSLELATLRHKGHSHFQNVKSSKQAGDRLKASIISGYCNRIKWLVIEHGPDPKFNMQLERLITDATNNNVPKDTLMRAIQQAVSKPVISTHIDYKGPGGSFLIIDCLIHNKTVCQYTFNGLLKKVPGGFSANDKTALSYFEHVGTVTILNDSMPPSNEEAASKKGWNAPPPVDYPPPLSFEDAETLAIELNALSVNEAVDSQKRPAYEIICEPDHVKRIEKELSSKKYVLISCGQEFRPLCKVTLSAQHMQYIDQFYNALEDVEEIQGIYDNIAHPGED